MGSTVTAGTDQAKFKRGSTVLACGATVKPCETLGTSWSTSGQYMVEGYGGVLAASGGKCDNLRADDSLVSWTMPSTGSGNVGVKITYATGSSSAVRQTAACDYTLDTSDTSACGSSSPPTPSPTPTPTPSGASPTPAPTPAPSGGSYSAPSAAPAAANGANRSIAGLMTCAALALAASVLAVMA